MWLSLIFLFGFAACYPYGSPKGASDEAVLRFMFDMQEAMDMPYAEEYDEDTKTELGKKLKEDLDNVLEKIKDAVDKGKDIRDDLKEKAKELRQKLKDLRIDIGDKAKELIEKIKEKAKDLWQKLLDKLGSKDNEFAYTEIDEDDIKTDFGKKLKEHLDHILEKIKESIDKGKGIKLDLLEKVKTLREQLQNLKIDIGNKAKEFIERIKDKAKDWYKKLREIFETKEFSETYDEFAYTEFDEDDPKTELGKKLKKELDDILEKIKDGVEKGKGLKDDLVDKAKELRERLKDLRIDIGDKAKDLIEKIKERTKDFWQKLLEKLGLKDSEFAYTEIDEEDTKTELGKMLKEHLDHILEKIKENIDKGKEIKLDLLEKVKTLREQLQNLKIDIGNKAKEFIERIKDKAKDWFKKLREIFETKEFSETYDEFAYTEFDEDDPKTELGKKLKKNLDDILEKIKDGVEKGKGLSKELVDKAKELVRQLKDLKVDIGDKAKELYERIKKKFQDWLDELLNKLGRKEFSDIYEDIDLPAVLNGILEKIENQDSTEDIAEYNREELRDSPLGEALSQTLRQGKMPLKQVVKTLLGLTRKDRRSLKDIYDKIKDYLKDLHGELKDKYDHFLEWVKDIYSKGKEAAKDKIDNVKDVAREFIENAKNVKKEVAEEALEFFRPYKHDLGELWEQIKKSAKEVIGH